MPESTEATNSSPRKKPRRVITPRLRVLLYVVLTLFGVLAANGLYLTGVTWLQHFSGRTYESHFYQLMFLSHVGLGLLLIVPVVVFGLLHMWRAKDRRNRRAVKVGYALLAISMVILISGLLLTRIGKLNIVNPSIRSAIYWAHLLTPLLAVWLYWLHRLVGPRIKWHIGRRVGVAIACFVIAMVTFQASDPRISDQIAPASGEQYFEPSPARTATGKFINQEVLMNDEYCLRCHSDLHHDWLHSAHKLSSFNNPAYRASVRESRKVVFQRNGSVQASRWCAGCHDPVPFFSGKFDDPNYDDVGDPTAHAGVTCTACHAIQSINSNIGNGDYTIDEPQHYPFAYSKNAALQTLSDLMVKAKPAFHKQQMLKPFHKTAEFCAVCHKVSLPGELTDYKDWLRGQNHYDSYLLSGVSGHGARSFYYPPKAEQNCNECHMPARESDHLGAKYSEQLGELAVHDHRFPSANSALSHWIGDEHGIEAHRKLLKNSLRIDLFGLRTGGKIDGELIAPLPNSGASVVRGQSYLLETVLRTLTLGHHFTQGTTDSNQIWIEITAKQGDRLIGQSGRQNDRRQVDPWSHFVNNFVVDREGNRINRRNAQDIFTTLYNHQMPPGAGQTIHYLLQVPADSDAPIQITARLLYRKFDTEYLDYVRADRDPQRDPLDLGQVGDPNDLPVIEISRDSITLSVTDSQMKPDEPSAMSETSDDPTPIPTWQRWNDYGIGLLLKGKAELKQAAEAFTVVGELGRYDGPLNLARVQFAEGDLDGATESLTQALEKQPPPPSWTHAWLAGSVNRQQGNLQTAAKLLQGTLDTRVPERGFDFSFDYVVRNELALTLLDIAQRADMRGNAKEFETYLTRAKDEFLAVLKIDSENATAHSNLAKIAALAGDESKREYHRRQHDRYKLDDSAPEIALPAARRKYPAANHAAEALVIYDLGRPTNEQHANEQHANEQQTSRSE